MRLDHGNDPSLHRPQSLVQTPSKVIQVGREGVRHRVKRLGRGGRKNASEVEGPGRR
jgi:hypothetical protein